MFKTHHVLLKRLSNFIDLSESAVRELFTVTFENSVQLLRCRELAKSSTFLQSRTLISVSGEGGPCTVTPSQFVMFTIPGGLRPLEQSASEITSVITSTKSIFSTQTIKSILKPLMYHCS